MLNVKELKELLDYDPITGDFTWKVSRSNRITIGSVAGCRKEGYVVIHIGGHQYYAHRLAFLYMEGCWPDNVDHEDGDRANTTFTNLTSGTHKDNMRNCQQRKPNSTGFHGVYKSRNRYVAQHRHKHLGSFSTPEDAALAKKAAELKDNFHNNHGRSSHVNRFSRSPHTPPTQS